MCFGKGMNIRKDEHYPDYLWDSNNHEPLVEKFNLKDDTILRRNFIRIELLPLNSLTSQNPDDWDFHIDETETLPDWFVESKSDWEYKCKHELVTIIIPKWIKEGVGGSLDLQNTQVKDLGKLTSVGGSLDLRGTQVKDLGKVRISRQIYR